MNSFDSDSPNFLKEVPVVKPKLKFRRTVV